MKPLSIAVIGAGPVGLALALLAAQMLPRAQISLFDARAADRDVAADPRTLALSLGSIQLLERISAWDAARAEPIREVWVSQQAPALVPHLAVSLLQPASSYPEMQPDCPTYRDLRASGGRSLSHQNVC